MEKITISGRVYDKPEITTDKRGNKYTRFRVFCTSTDMGETITTKYRCTSYDLKCATLRVNDIVFVSGTFIQKTKVDENGIIWISNDIRVDPRGISKGSANPEEEI